MAAAPHGAPVSTIDIDLFFRKTPANMQKLKRVAEALEAVILRPYYPVSALFRLQRDRDGLADRFMGQIDGVKSYERVLGRAASCEIGGHKLHPPQSATPFARWPICEARARLLVIMPGILGKTFT